MKNVIKKAASVFALSLSMSFMVSCGGIENTQNTNNIVGAEKKAERWDYSGNPERFNHLGASYEYRLKELPTEGQATQETWAGYYWATYKDAINYKWNGLTSDSPTAKYAKAFGLDPVALENAVSKKSGIDSRSSAKSCKETSECDSSTGESCAKRTVLDAEGNYTEEENGRCVPTWFGQCHAWAPAAVMEPEPIDPVTINGVTFKAQDIKALITYVYNNVDTDFLGGRCNTNDSDVTFDEYGRPESRKCRDTNPGTMHVVLANWIGIHGKAIVEDRTWDDEVWNQPVRGFKVNKLEQISETAASELMGVANVGGTTLDESGTVKKTEWLHFGPFTAPEGAYNVSMTGSGDADLHVKMGEQPSDNSYDCRPYAGGSTESCSVVGPGEVYVSVKGYADTSDFELKMAYGGEAKYIFNNDAVEFYHVEADVKYITESSPTTDGNLNEDSYTRTDSVEYILEVDANGKIIGGEWIDNAPHADFLWVPTAHAGDYYIGSGFTFEYNKIKDILNQSIGATVVDDNTPTGDNVTVTVTETGSVAKNEWLHFGPYTTTGIFEVEMTGTNDADLFVRKGNQPTAGDYDCRPYKSGSTEACSLNGSGEYYVSVNGYSSGASDVSLKITYTGEDNSGNGGNDNGGNDTTTTTEAVTVTESGSIAKSEWKHYGPFLAVSGEFKAAMTGSGDADIYVRKGAQPTDSDYDCRPYDSHTDETCTLDGPGEFYVSINGWADNSDFSLNITYTKNSN